MYPQDIYEFIKVEENRYDTEYIQLLDTWEWNMKRHLQMSAAFSYAKFTTGSNDYQQNMRSFKNITRPMIKLRRRSENIDVKDIELYVDHPEQYALSFLIRKYYQDVYIVENDLDTFLDESYEEFLTFAGVLVQKTDKARPEVLPLQSIAFCDQTDIMGGPIGFKHYFSPGKLREMAKLGWGDPKNGATITINELIEKSETYKSGFETSPGKKNITTGKNCEVYIIRGELPESYLREDGDEDLIIPQVQIVAFYDTKREHKAVLYRMEESESPLKFFTTDKIFRRALGYGGVEELFEAQIATNKSQIRKDELLTAASKLLLYTDDPAYANRQKIKDMEYLEVTVIEDGKSIQQVPTVSSQSIQLFLRDAEDWFQHAQLMSGATDALLGQNPPSGTPFRLENLVSQQGQGLHEYYKGKFAKFVEEIHKDWIVPHMTKEISKGKRFLSTLSSDDMDWLSEQIAENEANRQRNEQVLNGEIPRDKEMLKQKAKDEFAKGGNKRFLEILKGEIKESPIGIKINIAGKQKNLVEIVDKLSNIFRQIFTNPMILQDPMARKTFLKILEYSGLEPNDFDAPRSQAAMMPQNMMQPSQGAPQLATNQMQ